MAPWLGAGVEGCGRGRLARPIRRGAQAAGLKDHHRRRPRSPPRYLEAEPHAGLWPRTPRPGLAPSSLNRLRCALVRASSPVPDVCPWEQWGGQGPTRLHATHQTGMRCEARKKASSLLLAPHRSRQPRLPPDRGDCLHKHRVRPVGPRSSGSETGVAVAFKTEDAGVRQVAGGPRENKRSPPLNLW